MKVKAPELKWFTAVPIEGALPHKQLPYASHNLQTYNVTMTKRYDEMYVTTSL